MSNFEKYDPDINLSPPTGNYWESEKLYFEQVVDKQIALNSLNYFWNNLVLDMMLVSQYHDAVVKYQPKLRALKVLFVVHLKQVKKLKNHLTLNWDLMTQRQRDSLSCADLLLEDCTHTLNQSFKRIFTLLHSFPTPPTWKS